MIVLMLMMGLGNVLLTQNYLFLLMMTNRMRQTQNILDLLGKRSYALRRMKEKQRRAANRKRRGYWYDIGRTDQWWQNLLAERKTFICSHDLLYLFENASNKIQQIYYYLSSILLYYEL